MKPNLLIPFRLLKQIKVEEHILNISA